MGQATGYIGETDAKRLARLQLYQQVLQLQPASVRSEGTAVVLAGPEAGEVGCLRHILGMRARQVIFVDNACPEGLVRARKAWPGVGVYEGDVLDVLRSLSRPLAFLHLDFMGLPNPERARILQAARAKASEGSVVAYTFFRGREKPTKGIWRDILQVPTVRRPVKGSTWSERLAPVLDEKRFVGYAQHMQEMLGGSIWTPVFQLRYDARHPQDNERHAPMGMIAFQKAPLSMRSSWWEEAVMRGKSDGAQGGTLTGKNVDEYVRNAALALAHRGKTSKEIARILNLDVGTVKAWRAHSTRGTYDGK